MIGELAALGSALTWAVTSVLLRDLQARINVLSLNAFRCLLAAIMGAAAVVATGRLAEIASLSAPTIAYLLASVLIGLGLGDTLFFVGLRFLGVARGLPLSNVYPIFAALMATALLGEPLTAGLVVGTFLVVSGVVLVLLPSGVVVEPKRPKGRNDEKLGVGLILLAALAWAGATGVLKVGVQSVEPIAATTVRMVMATVVLMGTAAFARGGLQLRDYRGRRLGAMLVAGVATGLSALLFLIAIQLAGAAKTATLSSTTPLFGVPMSMLSGERLTWQVATGTLISLIGIWMVAAT